MKRTAYSTLAGAILTAAGLAGAAEASAKAYVPCVMKGESENGYFTKPKRCTFNVMGSDPRVSANNVDVIKLRWSAWGGATAKASGVQAGAGGFRDKVSVTLRKRERCDANWIYREVVIRAHGKERFRFKLVGCQL
jgi:hypothetical protein